MRILLAKEIGKCVGRLIYYKKYVLPLTKKLLKLKKKCEKSYKKPGIFWFAAKSRRPSNPIFDILI